MGDFLVAVSTTTRASSDPIKVPPPHRKESGSRPKIQSPQDALEILKSKPSYDALEHVLAFLRSENGRSKSFAIDVPGPLSTQIINILVRGILPDYWPTIGGSDPDKDLRKDLLGCLKSVAGLGAFVAYLKALAAESKQKQGPTAGVDVGRQIVDILSALTETLKDHDFSQNIWSGMNLSASNSTQKLLLWKEYISLAASSKILSVAAEAEQTLNSSTEVLDATWIANGADFAAWLGANTAYMAGEIDADDASSCNAVAQLCGKAFSLGHNDRLVAAIHHSLPLKQPKLMAKIRLLISKLPNHHQKLFLNSSVSIISKENLANIAPSIADFSATKSSKEISGAASFLAGAVQGNDSLKDHIVDMLVGKSGAPVNEGLEIRRALIAVLAQDDDRMERLLEKSMELFGDQLYVKHTPILQQEVLSQILLIAAGYVKRLQPTLFLLLARSSNQMQGISNRLGASSPRARFLGMVVGMAISELVDKPENRMKFDLEDTQTPEAKWYRQLIYTQDEIGKMEDLVSVQKQAESPSANNLATRSLPVGRQKPTKKPISKEPQKALKIVEIDDDSDEDLIPYAKPDSDAEDDTEDATMVRRNKPRAPVYIRDLIEGLRETDDYDKHFLALSTASNLIRRKANFGKEVLDHIEELATSLINLGDPFEIDDFQKLRQQALIAVLLASPSRMGPWFAKTFFDSDFSISQRLALLTSLSLGARELAGFKEDTDEHADSANDPKATAATARAFPSKMLPDRLHALYADSLPAVESVSRRMERAMIQPMAMRAADDLAGPTALKVRTFSSRMEVEKRRKRPVANELAKVVAESFFFPLTNRWWTHVQALGSQNIIFSTHLLPIFLKSLAIILQASGPSTLALPQMTSELWDLLLSVRAHALDDAPVLEALLFAFLVLLEVNEDRRRLAREHSKELLETQGWVKLVYERTEGRDAEGERVRMLAAGILVRAGEVMEEHQRVMLGDMANF